MNKRYRLSDKVAALRRLDALGGDFQAASTEIGVSDATLRTWKRQQLELMRQHSAHLQQQDALLRADLQQRMTQRALDLVEAIDAERIDGAPLNQLASALGVLVDRMLKLDTDEEAHDHDAIIRIEYRYPDGTLHDAPPWAAPDPAASGPLQGGGLRAPLRQDGDGQNRGDRDRAAWRSGVVAGADLSDGGSGLARPEGCAGPGAD